MATYIVSSEILNDYPQSNSIFTLEELYKFMMTVEGLLDNLIKGTFAQVEVDLDKDICEMEEIEVDIECDYKYIIDLLLRSFYYRFLMGEYEVTNV